MKRNFLIDSLELSVERYREGKLLLIISSDYSGGCHKSQLHVNEKSFAEKLEELWKSIKTKKLLHLHAGFGEIDHYDDMTDTYSTPNFHIERGLKKARITYSEHGSIPKDWCFSISAIFADTTTNTPIIEACQKTLGFSLFTPAVKKAFIKSLRPVLQKKKAYCSYSLNNNN